MRAALAVLAFFSSVVPALANGDSLDMNPGKMGFNAMPTIPNADPVIGSEAYVIIEAAGQASRDFSDGSLTPYFHVIIPLNSVVALEGDGTPVEFWYVSPHTRERIGAERTRGISRGDTRFGARAFLLAETEYTPAVGIRFFTKTNTGKDLENRRFTDAPAYVADAIFGKDVFSDEEALVSKVRLLAKVGVLIWQQGVATQNDALDYGATAQLTFKEGTRAEIEWRGFTGYQSHDDPMLVGVRLTSKLTQHFDWTVAANTGLNKDAPAWEVRAGVRGHMKMPAIKAPRWILRTLFPPHGT